jgi:hypothetical protein
MIEKKNVLYVLNIRRKHYRNKELRGFCVFDKYHNETIFVSERYPKWAQNY